MARDLNNTNEIDFEDEQSKELETRKITFIVKDIDDINANASCHTSISEIAHIGRLMFHEEVASCSTRNGIEDPVVQDCRKLILKQLHLKEKHWEVIFTSNATDSINIATALIYNYTRSQSIDYRYFVSTLSHNSLYLPAQKQAVIYKHKLELFDSFDKSMFKNSIISMPYIDNILGINHWKSFFSQEKLQEMKVNCLRQNNVINNTHIILDAAQAGLQLFNPYPNNLHERNRWKLLPKLDLSSAICLSGHKFHATHIGILVIRKEFLKQDLFLMPEIKVGGGSISFVSSDPNIKSQLLQDYRGLEAGLINTESIYGLYNWLLTLEAINNNLLAVPVEAKHWLKSKIDNTLNNFKIIDRSYLDFSFRNTISGNNIILIDCNQYLSIDVLSELLNNNIESRDGSFCCDLAMQQLKLPNNLLRLSFDYTFTKLKAEKIYNILYNLDNALQ